MTDATASGEFETVLTWSPASAEATSRQVRVDPGEPRLGITETGARDSVLRRERAYRRALLLCDLLVVGLTPLMLTLLGAFPGGELQGAAVLLLPGTVLGAKLAGLYDRDALLIRKTTLDEFPRLAVLALLLTFVVWFGEAAFVDGQLDRSTAAALVLTLSTGLLLGRWATRALVRRALPPERCMLIGDRAAQSRLEGLLQANSHAVLACRISLGSALLERTDDAAALDLLRQLVKDLDIDRVIIEPSTDRQQTYTVIRGAKHLGVRVSIHPDVMDVIGSAVAIDDLRGAHLLGLHRFGLTRSSAVLKRTMDVIGATAALVLLSPLLALIAIAVKLDSPGPVCFRQMRVGRHGDRFRIVKFRSMVADADSLKAELEHLSARVGLFKVRADPRVTRVGRLLRSTSLDELPQLINVVRGEMSLVGPRPLIVDEDRLINGWDRRRLALTPGMTGPWQIAGSRDISLADMVKIDYGYAATWSLWNDCKILLRTVTYMLARSGL